MSSEASDVVICRTCITECEKFKSLHKEGLFLGEMTTLGTLLSYLADLEISPNEDFMPSNICLRCVQHLTSSFVFKRMVIEADEELRGQKNVCVQKGDNGENVVYPSSILAASELKKSLEDTEFASISDIPYEENEETTTDLSSTTEHLKIEQAAVWSSESNKFILPDAIDNSLKEDSSPEVAESEVVSKIRQIHVNRTGPKRTQKSRGKKEGVKFSNTDWQCQVCDKQLSNQHSFKYHMQLHSDETPFICSLCGEGFKTRNSYEGHLAGHDPNNPNTCPICGKAYRQPSSLRTHMLSHTGEKPYRCNICGKGMTQKSGYKKHMLIHTGEKPHTCEICGRDFRYSSNLIAHKRCHSGEKPYACPHCPKCFPTSEQMKRHIIVHTGERPYSCDLCGKSFKRRSSIVSHRHTHTETYDLQTF